MTMSAILAALRAELRQWADRGLTAVFWLRDDDAVTITPALERLEVLARRHDISVGLAIVPGRLQADLIARLMSPASPFFPMCHGWVHTNHAAPTRPAELAGPRPLEAIRADLAQARAVMAQALAVPAPFVVPPFGQIARSIAAELGALGFAGLSNQNSRPLDHLVRLHAKYESLPPNPLGRPMWPARLDAHIDPIDWWRQTAREHSAVCERLLGELRLRRKGYKPADSPIGLLAHHLVHDEAIWDSLDQLITLLKAAPSAVFPPVRDLAARHAFKRRSSGQGRMREYTRNRMARS